MPPGSCASVAGRSCTLAARYRNTDPSGGAKTYGFADKHQVLGEEDEEVRDNDLLRNGSHTKKIGAGRLDFDPLLNETSVSFGKNRIKWQGRGDYYPDALPIADPEFGAAVYASLDREARAKGKVLGLNLRSRSWKDWGYLSEGVFGGVLTTKHGKVTYNDDGTITYRLKFRHALK